MARIDGNDGPNTINDTAGDDQIYAKGGNDTVIVTLGRDWVDGGTGDDTMKIDWADAAQDIWIDNTYASHAFVNTGTDFDDSTRRVDYQFVEHMDVTAGSGDDHLEGARNSWDRINGGAGSDKWVDSFSERAVGLSIDMANVASSGGETYADGSTIRNVEIADLTLTAGDDRFKDQGAFDDVIRGHDGNDRITVSGGRDWVDGGTGDDTMKIDWSDAAQDIWIDNTYASHAFVNTGTDFGDSTRRVDYQFVEHMDVKAGSGDDHLEGARNSWDRINGGAGSDKWVDSFSERTVGLSIDMARMSSAAGQGLADGSRIRNVEIADLTLTKGNDKFKDQGAFDDVIRGHDGNDRITVSGGRDWVDGGTGDDTMKIDWSDAAQDIWIDNTYASHAFVNTGTDFDDSTRRVDYQFVEHMDVTAGSGDDHLEGARNSWDRINGGAGSDKWVDSFSERAVGLSIDMANVASSGGETYADGSTIRNVEIADLTLTAGDDRFKDQGAFDDVIRGHDGNDRITVSGGRDWVDGGTGDDTMKIDWSDAAQDIWIDNTYASHAFVNTGTDFGDSTRRVDYQFVEHMDVKAGSGDDHLEGARNSWDRINGGAGSDKWVDSFSERTVGLSIDMARMSSAAGQGLADGSRIRNVEIADLTLTKGNDKFKDQGAFDDVIRGHDGNDRITVSGGRDWVDGGTGNDTLVIDWSDATQEIVFNNTTSSSAYVNTGTNFGDSIRRVDFQFVEKIIVRFGAGSDSVTAGAGNDVLVGGAGGDSLDGNAGTDTVSYAASDAGVTVNLRTGAGLGGHAEGDVLLNIENLNGSRFDDRLTGDSAGNLLKGGRGNDSLFGGGGADVLRGQGGEDVLSGAAGNDRLEGGAGADRMSGGGGADRLVGGNGADVLNGNDGNDRLFGGNHGDTLTGGRGNDILAGGGGRDTLVFARNSGADTVTDFANDLDTLQFDDRLWSGTLTRAQVVSRFASADGDDVLFNFDGGESVRLAGYLTDNAIASLTDDLAIV